MAEANQNTKLVAAGQFKPPSKGLSWVKLKWTWRIQSRWVSSQRAAAAQSLRLERGSPDSGTPVPCPDPLSLAGWWSSTHLREDIKVVLMLSPVEVAAGVKEKNIILLLPMKYDFL